MMTGISASGQLQVFTLGSFDVRKNEQSLVVATARSYRLWELFKYVVTNREKPVFIEFLIDLLWSEKDSVDPNNALKTQMYRLRKHLGQDQNPGHQYILFSNNCYKWNNDADIWLDVAVFEDYVEQGRLAHKQGRRDEAFRCFSCAARLYKGRYLIDSPFTEWLLNARSHYHRLYIEIITYLVGELARERRHEELAALCEEAFKIENYEESWHRLYIEALLQTGQQRLARAHYENIAAAYQRELGVTLSPELRQMSRRILGERLERGENLDSITRSFNRDMDARGAFVCEPGSFRKLYELEMRRNERNGQSVFLGMIYMDAGPATESSISGSNPARAILAESIIKGLRRGDVVTEWRPNQYLVLLPGLNYEQAEKVLARLIGNSRLDACDLACELLPLQIADLMEQMDRFTHAVPVNSVPA